MGYYQGDYYRGDYYQGGIFSGIGKAFKKLLPVASSFVPGVGGVIGKLGGSIGRVAPKVRRALPGVIGGAGGLIGARIALQGGRDNGEGRTYRRMNVTNVKALRRAIRRARGFAKLARKVLTYPIQKPPKGRALFKKRGR